MVWRLTGVDYGDGEMHSYTFDPMGNRLSKVVNGISEGYTYDNANRLLTRGTASYTNDENGNTLTDGAANRTMTWDSQNRMASCTFNGTTSTFTYGADGLRRRMVTGTNTTDYLLDGQNVVREIKNGVVNATYLNGPRGSEYKRDQNGAVQWYLYDGLGSVVGLVDESGNVTNSRKYDVYGAPRNTQTGSAHCFVGGLGHTSDAETGLIYMRARCYDPATGRFVSEDPARSGANWLTYCQNDPVNLVDGTGKEPTPSQIIFAIIAAFAGLAGAAVGALTTFVALAEVGHALLGLTLGLVALSGGGGTGMAILIGMKVMGASVSILGVTLAGPALFAVGAIMALAAVAAVCGILAMFDDPVGINGLFEGTGGGDGGGGPAIDLPII